MRQWESRREYECSLFAGLQATLHNGFPFVRPQGKAFTPAMFMPGHVPMESTDDWQAQQALLKAAMAQRKIPTIEERRAKKQKMQQREERNKRALAASERGASREEIQRIMEG